MNDPVTMPVSHWGNSVPTPTRTEFATVAAASLAQLEQRLAEMSQWGYVQVGAVMCASATPALQKEYFCLMSRRVS